MTLKELIEDKYGSIDKLIKETDVQLSRTYLYSLVYDDTVNPSLEVMQELSKVLEVEVKDIVEAIRSSRHRD